MINFDDLTKENIKEHNIRIIITEVSGSRKINSLFNLLSHQRDIIKIYFMK